MKSKPTKQTPNFQNLFLVDLFLGRSLKRETKDKILSVPVGRRTLNKLQIFF